MKIMPLVPAQDQRGKRDCALDCTELAQPAMVSEVFGASNDSPVANSDAERSLISGEGLSMTP